MDKGTLQIAPAMLFEEVRRERVAAGRLMNPTEVRGALVGRENLPEEVSGWVVCGNIHPKMFGEVQAKGGQVKHATSFLELDSGRNYLIAIQQVDRWQHRFVLPLVGEKVADFIAALGRQSLCMSLAAGQSEEALVTSLPLPADHVQGYGNAVRRVNGTVAELFEEFSTVALTLLQRPYVEGIGGLAVPEGVCLTLVAQPVIEEALLVGMRMQDMKRQDMAVH